MVEDSALSFDYDESDRNEEEAEKSRKKKQLYLIENVAEGGFDTSKFNMFVAEKKGILTAGFHHFQGLISASKR